MAYSLSRTELLRYVETRKGISEDCKRFIKPQLEALDWNMPVADLREEIIKIFRVAIPVYSNASAQLSAALYDVIREAETGEALGAVALSGYDAAATDGAIKAIIEDVVKGKPNEGTINKLLNRAGYEVQKSAGSCMYNNGYRDEKRVMYARVPSGIESCGFCIMLASRGYVYYSEESAGSGGHYHDNCSCSIIPSFGGGGGVEGYDPAEFRKIYDDMVENGEIDKAALAASAKKAHAANGQERHVRKQYVERTYYDNNGIKQVRKEEIGTYQTMSREEWLKSGRKSANERML